MKSEDPLVRLSVWRHLPVDTKTLLEKNINSLNEKNCRLEDVDRNDIATHGRLMIARLSSQVDAPKPPRQNRPKVDYNRAHTEEDRFFRPLPAGPRRLGTIGKDHILRGYEGPVGEENGLRDEHHKKLENIVSDRVDIFRCSFSSSSLARLPPLKIQLTPDTRLVKIRWHNYSVDRERVMGVFIKGLVRHGMAYLNHTSKWPCALLLVPKPGTKCCLTSNVRVVKKHTIKN